MPRWRPEPKWQGQDVFVIGGGASLKSFDWNLLKPELTIGCNTAFMLGHEICKACIIGDDKCFDKFKKELAQYEGAVFTNAPGLLNSPIPWLWTIPRKHAGLYTDAVCWNGNTGASAINLALLLGAKRVLLLGFDMKLSGQGEHNWHNRRLDKTGAEVYDRFLSNYPSMAADLPKKFPGCEIVNIAKDSALGVFPKIDPDEFWKERKSK